GGRRRSRDSNGAQGVLMIIGVIFIIFAPIIAQLLQLAVSRKRELLADASGALLTRYPEGLASALEKLASDKEPLEFANKATAHLYIVNPLKDHRGFINNLFSTHPPVEERIRILRSM
ncbi:MAG: M48 family metalloprotease, partial [Bacillota bacterium]